MTVVKVLESAVKSTFKKLTQYCRILLCLLGLLYFALAALRRVCVCVTCVSIYVCVCGCACVCLSACACIYNACNLSARKTATKSKHFTVVHLFRSSVFNLTLSFSLSHFMLLFFPLWATFSFQFDVAYRHLPTRPRESGSAKLKVVHFARTVIAVPLSTGYPWALNTLSLLYSAFLFLSLFVPIHNPVTIAVTVTV